MTGDSVFEFLDRGGRHGRVVSGEMQHHRAGDARHQFEGLFYGRRGIADRAFDALFCGGLQRGDTARPKADCRDLAGAFAAAAQCRDRGGNILV